MTRPNAICTKETLRACNRHKLEVVREYPRPIRNEVILREGYVRIAAGDHLGKIAMHNADTAWKVRHLRSEESIGSGYSDQLADRNAVPGARTCFLDRIR
jgi:hypothetical protein